jgi:hypothetical protein
MEFKLEHRNSTSIKDGATPVSILHQLSEAIEQQQKLRNIPLSPSSKKAVKDTINVKNYPTWKNFERNDFNYGKSIHRGV